ncbi:MAG: ribosome silencing factor [Kiritimatiellae bacterium]|nr:ribosome silencing factor [Kiritimatiellia bacterium]
MTIQEKANLLRTALADKGAEDVKVYDLRGISGLADLFVLATGAASPHLKALVAAAEDAMRGAGEKAFRMSGEADSGWMVADFVDAVVHVFSPEARKYYALDKLWEKAKQI